MMTSLEKELQRRGLSIYKVVQLLDKNPKQVWSSWKNKIVGKTPLEYDDLLSLCEVIGTATNEPLTVDQIDVRPKTVLIK